MIEYRFIEPLDVLYLRGNKLFDGAGAHGAALMPPWPSLAAGALRSRMLADGGVDVAGFARGEPISDARLAEVLGTPAKPGSFRIAAFTLAQRINGVIEPCFPLPADVVVTSQDLEAARYLQPTAINPVLRSSTPLPQLPLLRAAKPGKPIGGLWLNGEGWRAYMNGEPLAKDHLLRSSKLWQTDPRLGIALKGSLGTAQTGMLYTAETVALCENTGFLAGIQGADGALPAHGLLRFGGDGRGATITACAAELPEPDWQRIESEKRFRLILATPGIFEQGWRLPGLESDNSWHGPDDCSARLVAACVNRADTVSGWDLAKWQPKPAQRAAPTGSVYWFDEFQGSTEALDKLATEGFWSLSSYPDLSRQAEGFNNVFIASWPRK
ncbi:MAG: type III-B CRISPR module-associated Cmr3 family protein [Candidatus Competibacteraceae bacterium]